MNSSILKSCMSRRVLLGAAAAWALAGAAHADATYPSRPLRMIVPFAAGGTGDIVARLVGNKLSVELGQSVVVDNRGGAGSVIGTDAGAKALPDGYTLTITNGAAITTGPLMGQRIPYKPMEDFAHVFLIGTFSNMLVVRPDFPAKNLKEYVEYSRKNPAGISWGSAGVGSAGFLAGELLAQLANAKMVHVPYKGTGPAMNDLLGGTLGAMLTSAAVAAPHIKVGKLRVLAVSSAERLHDFPDVPTMNETVPGAIGDAWFGISVPSKTPKEVVERLRSALVRVSATPELRTQLQDAGLTPLSLGPTEFDKFLRGETAKWAPVIRAANITSE